MKTKIKKLIKIFLLLSFLALASGCSTVKPPDSNMPWAQPADWEKENMLTRTGLGY